MRCGPVLRSPAMQTAADRSNLHSLYNNIKPPSWVGSGADFHLFKKGIEPKWEDPRCEHGGKWTVLVPKGPSGKQTMDTYWLNAVWQLDIHMASFIHCCKLSLNASLGAKVTANLQRHAIIKSACLHVQSAYCHMAVHHICYKRLLGGLKNSS